MRLLMEEVPVGFPLDEDDVPATTRWIADNLVVSWSGKDAPVLLLPKRPTVIFRGSNIMVDSEECEVCVFEVIDQEGGRLEIAARRDEYEDLRIFVKESGQRHCLGKTWAEIRDVSKNGGEITEVLEDILGQMCFVKSDEGNVELSVVGL